jgi:hypothetical protein
MRFPRCHPPSLDRIRSRFPALSAVAFRSFHLPALLPPCATKHGHGWRHGASAPPVVTAYHCVVSVRELWNGCMSRSNIRSAFVEIVSSCLFFDERLFSIGKKRKKKPHAFSLRGERIPAHSPPAVTITLPRLHTSGRPAGRSSNTNASTGPFHPPNGHRFFVNSRNKSRTHTLLLLLPGWWAPQRRPHHIFSVVVLLPN